MKHPRRTAFPAVLLAALTALLLSSCTVPHFYTRAEIGAMLKERYGLSFAVGEPRPADVYTRIYPVACAEYPDLPFEAADTWSPPGWSGGSGGVPPLPHGARHSLRDSFRAVSWNRYAVPLLALYGVKGLEIPPENHFAGVDYFARGVQEYQILLSDDIDWHTERLYTLLCRLDSLPAFSSAAPQPNGSYPNYGVPISLTVADGIGNTAEHLRLAVGHGYEEAELAEALNTLRRTVRNNLKRELERAGVIQAALDRVEYPAIGSDFFYLANEESSIFAGDGAFACPPDWAGLPALVPDGTGTVSIYPAASLAERSWYCAALPDHEGRAALCFCIDPETGAVWQYAPRHGGVFLMDTGIILPPEALLIFPDAD